MTWRTSRAALGLRILGRSLGLNRRFGAWLGGADREARFKGAMLGAIQPGDVVWDVGANVGRYSACFSERTGCEGFVYAFEPSPENLSRLAESVSALGNVFIMPMALGHRDGIVRFRQGEDALGETSHIAEGDAAASHCTVEARISTGDALTMSGEARHPNIIKIDTEGYELEVVMGLENILHSTQLRAVCIEVHFGLLHERGLGHAPAELEGRLSASGFKIHWPDVSHLIGLRC